MKSAELRDLSVEELGRKAAEMRENLFNLKIRHAAGTLDSSATLGSTRHELARVLTVLTQKQAGQPKAPAKAAAAAPAPAKSQEK
jgi:large subunit ribosomal protein L29